MAKQRNSLGMLVLTVPEEDMTWSEYKNKYGIDLEKILFAVNIGTTENPEYTFQFRKDFRKLIVVSYNEHTTVPCVSIPTCIIRNEADISNASMTLECSDKEGLGGYYIVVYADKRIVGGEI